MTECALETDVGIRVPDVAWASPDFMSRHAEAMNTFARAPELCIEALSPANSRPEMQGKTEAYLAAGALEVWLIAEDGTVEMLDEGGRLAESSLGITIGPLPP